MNIKVEALDKSKKAIMVTNYETDEIALFSYETHICTVKNCNIVELTTYWDYSKTTLKHLKVFLDKRCHFNDKYINKKDFEKRMKERGLL